MLRTLTLADAVYIASHMRERDLECLRAVTEIANPEVFGLNRWQTDGPAWTLVKDGLPVAMGGISMSAPWCGTAWMVSTNGLDGPTSKKLIRHARTVFSNASKAIARIEAHVLGTWPEAEKFAARLGFEHEGTRRRAGRDGQDILTFVYRGTT
jgi:hypothetical protein